MSDGRSRLVRRSLLVAASASALAFVPLVCASSHASPDLVDAGLPPPQKGKQLPEGGSLRRDDASLLPDAAELPDAITPPMLRDASIPEVHPVPLLD